MLNKFSMNFKRWNKMSTVTILGKLGGDVELKDINGTALAKFSVAQNVGFGDKKSVNWFNVSIWGGQAKSNFVDYLKKGQMVQVVGELSTREYNGKTYMEVRSYSCNLAGSPQGGQQQAPQQEQPKPQAQPKPTAGGGTSDLEDDLPFAPIDYRSV